MIIRRVSVTFKISTAKTHDSALKGNSGQHLGKREPADEPLKVPVAHRRSRPCLPLTL